MGRGISGGTLGRRKLGEDCAEGDAERGSDGGRGVSEEGLWGKGCEEGTVGKGM